MLDYRKITIEAKVAFCFSDDNCFKEIYSVKYVKLLRLLLCIVITIRD